MFSFDPVEITCLSCLECFNVDLAEDEVTCPYCGATIEWLDEPHITLKGGL